MSGSLTIEQIFAGVPLFSRLSARQRSRLAKRATTRAYHPGDVIVKQGDSGMALYIVLSGSARVERSPDESDGGAAVEIAQLEPAGFFGEMGLIEDVPRSATVVAVGPTECALLSKWDFRKELRNDPDIAIALLPVLNGRIRALEARLAKEQPEVGAGLTDV